MPFVPTDVAQGTQAPKVPHLAIWDELRHQWFPALPGMTVCLVEDAANPTKIFPMYLHKVSHKQLQFALEDANGGVSLYTYKLVSGKPLNRQAVERMAKNRK